MGTYESRQHGKEALRLVCLVVSGVVAAAGAQHFVCYFGGPCEIGEHAVLLLLLRLLLPLLLPLLLLLLVVLLLAMSGTPDRGLLAPHLE